VSTTSVLANEYVPYWSSDWASAALIAIEVSTAAAIIRFTLVLRAFKLIGIPDQQTGNLWIAASYFSAF
jgi:hypothetical protein